MSEGNEATKTEGNMTRKEKWRIRGEKEDKERRGKNSVVDGLRGGGGGGGRGAYVVMITGWWRR